MLYYVANTNAPLDVPWGVSAVFHGTEASAIAEANEYAAARPGTPFYVHAFPESQATFKALARVELDSEYLDADSRPE